MPEVIIRVEGLGKKYRIRHQSSGEEYRTLREAIANRARALFTGRATGGKGSGEEDFWALRDVSFEVRRGEILGIIGRNGAGKSTLLKILSGITEPTEGRVVLDGRVASLLEVGTGFHPELTGRENIFLNGAILGMGRAEMRAKFDEIVDFAEVERFIDTPVKRYSSGMYVRLAFAVAAHLEPEIMVVDEVLAVGDAAFQKKCLGKMSETSREAGRTVLFVSHNMGVIANLCSRVVLLESGGLREEGPAGHVISTYVRSSVQATGMVEWRPDDLTTGNGRLRLNRAGIFSEGRLTADVAIDRETTLEFEFELLDAKRNVASSIHLFDKQGVWVLCSGHISGEITPGRYSHRVTFPANFLNDGIYTVSIILLTEVTNTEVHKTEAISFCVHESGAGREHYGGIINGCIRPQLPWSAKQLP